VTDIIRIGIDTSKSIFQLHGVDASERPVFRKQLSRREMIKFFEKLPPTILALEAYGASRIERRPIRLELEAYANKLSRFSQRSRRLAGAIY